METGGAVGTGGAAGEEIGGATGEDSGEGEEIGAETGAAGGAGDEPVTCLEEGSIPIVAIYLI